jgi:hypothetical protein
VFAGVRTGSDVGYLPCFLICDSRRTAPARLRSIAGAVGSASTPPASDLTRGVILGGIGAGAAGFGAGLDAGLFPMGVPLMVVTVRIWSGLPRLLQQAPGVLGPSVVPPVGDVTAVGGIDRGLCFVLQRECWS